MYKDTKILVFWKFCFLKGSEQYCRHTIQETRWPIVDLFTM